MSRSEIVVDSYLPTARLTLLNHEGAIVASSSSRLTTSADPGIYRLQVEVGPSTTEEFVTLLPDQQLVHSINVTVPAVTPVKGSTSNHQWHSSPATQLSRESTGSLGRGSRLMVFVRVVEQVEGLTDLRIAFENLELLDEHSRGLPVTSPMWQRGPGFVGLSLDVDPGNYLLRSPAEPNDAELCLQTLVTLPGWTTLVFMPAVPTRTNGTWVPAAVGSVVHMIGSGTAFEPYDYGSDAIFSAEMALDGLRSGQVVMPASGWHMLSKSQLTNPMLGVYVAHSLLAERAIPSPRLKTLVRDLRATIPGHPDVDALHVGIKDREHRSTRSRLAPLQVPPMLRPSYQLLIARDSIEPGLIRDGSLAESASTRQLQDAVWARWDNTSRDDPKGVVVDSGDLDAAVRTLSRMIDRSDLQTVQTSGGGEGRSVTLDAARLAQLVRRMWGEPESGKALQPISLSALSRHVGLPVSKVRNDIAEIGSASRLDFR